MSFHLRHYPRSTRNFYYCIQDGLTVWYSYKTAVAVEVNGERYVCENVWSVTTGKHLTWIDGGDKEAKKVRVPYPAFRLLCDKYAIEKTNEYQTHYLTPEDVKRIELLKAGGV